MSILQKLYLRTNSHILNSNLLSQRRRLYSSKPNESIPKLNKSSPIRSLYFKSVIIWIIFGSVSLQLQWVKMEVNQLEEKFKVESLLLKDQIEKIDKDSEQENSNKELDLDELRKASRAKFAKSLSDSNDKNGNGPEKVLI